MEHNDLRREGNVQAGPAPIGHAPSAKVHAPSHAVPVGSKPIVWKWWLLAGLASVAVWAGIIALAT